MVSPGNVLKQNMSEHKCKSPNMSVVLESRQPLRDSNSQTSPGATSSQKRSRTTSDSIVITPCEKRQTELALSPERLLPAGQQWTTLEVQRVLSLTPGTRPAFRHSDPQHGSLEIMQLGTLHGSPASCRTGSTVAADASPAGHMTKAGSQALPTEGTKGANEQQPQPTRLNMDAFPETELQLPELPATQLACGATALDLLLYEATQVVDIAPGVHSPRPGLPIVAEAPAAQQTMAPQQQLALSLGNAQGLTATPVMMLAPIQCTYEADSDAVAYGRAPAGPISSRLVPIRTFGVMTSAADCVPQPSKPHETCALSVHNASEPRPPAPESDPQAQLEATALLQCKVTEADSSVDLPKSTGKQEEQQCPQKQQRETCQAEPVLQQGTLQGWPQSLHPSSCGYEIGTLEDSGSQVSKGFTDSLVLEPICASIQKSFVIQACWSHLCLVNSRHQPYCHIGMFVYKEAMYLAYAYVPICSASYEINTVVEAKRSIMFRREATLLQRANARSPAESMLFSNTTSTYLLWLRR